MRFFCLLGFLWVALGFASAQPVASLRDLPDAPDAMVAADPQPAQAQQPLPQNNGDTGQLSTLPPVTQPIPPSKQQPKRILGIMPNYRAVSAGAIPPPPTAKESLNMAAENSFDYSSFIFVGLTSLLAKGVDAHPQLGKGAPGLWAYTWRGFVDKTDGNYWVIFILPTMLHEDERYYTRGHGSILGRALYASSRVLITPNYQGRDTFNVSEVVGRGIAQGISLAYYPSTDRNAADLATKYGYAVLRDAATNVFREFWPDIAAHLHRRKL